MKKLTIFFECLICGVDVDIKTEFDNSKSKDSLMAIGQKGMLLPNKCALCNHTLSPSGFCVRTGLIDEDTYTDME